jgi:hypothetical protein
MEAIVATLSAAEAPALNGLKPGTTVSGRIARAADASGEGSVVVAGSVLQMKVPRGLRRGAKLALRVGKRGGDRLTLSFVRDDVVSRVPNARSRLAGRMATRGRAAALKMALALRPDGVIELPNGDVAHVRVDHDLPEKEHGKEAGEEDTHAASFTLHSPNLGPISIELVVSESALSARVVTEPGEAEARSSEALPELGKALELALDRPASIALAVREEDDERPQPPRLDNDVVDAYA